METNRICANCKKWHMGDAWCVNSEDEDHGVLVNCLGYCRDHRKRWNWEEPCSFFKPRKEIGFTVSGQGEPDLETMMYIYHKINKLVGAE